MGQWLWTCSLLKGLSGKRWREMWRWGRHTDSAFKIWDHLSRHLVLREEVAPTSLPPLGASPDARVWYVYPGEAPGAGLVGRGSGFRPDGPGKPLKSYKWRTNTVGFAVTSRCRVEDELRVPPPQELFSPCPCHHLSRPPSPLTSLRAVASLLAPRLRKLVVPLTSTISLCMMKRAQY